MPLQIVLKFKNIIKKPPDTTSPPIPQVFNNLETERQRLYKELN
jgi:hypothetical protein